MKWMAALALFAAAANGQGNKPVDPFGPTPEVESAQAPVPGARERATESLAILKERLTTNPADRDALERAVAILAYFGKESLLVPHARRATLAQGLDEKEMGALRGLLGHLLVIEAAESGWGRIVIVNGNLPPAIRRQIRAMGGGAPKLYREAEPHLRAALRANPRDLRALTDLATALLGIDEAKNADEANKLRNEAAALAARSGPDPGQAPLEKAAMLLRGKAARLEQKPTEPEHGRALELRQQALVLDFCARTIPFEYEPSLYTAVSLLASPNHVRNNLTRTYMNSAGVVATVPPLHHAPAENRRAEIVTRLGSDASNGAAATLLAVLRGAERPSRVAEAALEALLAGRQEQLREPLAELVKQALFNPDEERFPPYGQRLLVQLAGKLRSSGTASFLLSRLADDTDFACPRAIPEALAEIARPEDADLLIAAANDARHDISLRRRAVDAATRIAPGRVAEIVADPRLRVSLAAAAYRAEKSDEARAALLAAFDRPHEADDAARYCAELSIPEGADRIDQLLKAEPAHYAQETLRRYKRTIEGR